MGTKIGYARVSTDEQSLEAQIKQLQAAGCKRIFEERLSGKSTDGRIELRAALKFVEPGDLLMVTKLDRLARSTIDMLTIVTDLAKRGVTFRSLAEPWANTDSPAAELMLTVMGGIAQFERGRLRERQLDGIERVKRNREVSKETGMYKYSGRARKRGVTLAAIIELKAKGLKPGQIAKELSCGRATVYRVIHRAGANLAWSS